MMQRKDVSEIALLKAISNRSSTHSFPHEVLGLPEKLVERKMEQFDRRGLLDWGVSLRTAWLTPKGEARLRELEQVTDGLPD